MSREIQRFQRIESLSLRLAGPFAQQTEETGTITNVDFNENVSLLGLNWAVSLGAGAVVRQAQLRIKILQTQQVAGIVRATPFQLSVAIGGGSSISREYRLLRAIPINKGERLKIINIMADALLAGEEFGSSKEFLYE